LATKTRLCCCLPTLRQLPAGEEAAQREQVGRFAPDSSHPSVHHPQYHRHQISSRAFSLLSLPSTNSLSVPCPPRACKPPKQRPHFAYLGCEITCRPTHTAEQRHLTRSSMLFAVLKRKTVLTLLAASLLAKVAAQEDSTVQDDIPTSSAPPDPSPYPTAMIFLPGSLHGLPGDGRNLAASVITAVSGIVNYVLSIFAVRSRQTANISSSTKNVNQTAYAIACMYSAANSSAPGPQGCSLQSTITVTGGESTLIYTYNPIVTTDNGM
jgi:hypothetical protein